MGKKNEKSKYKIEAMKAAKDLGYDSETVKKIKAAKTDREIEHIMVQARKEKFK